MPKPQILITQTGSPRSATGASRFGKVTTIVGKEVVCSVPAGGTKYTWELFKPNDSRVEVVGTNDPTFSFTPDIAGGYQVYVTVDNVASYDLVGGERASNQGRVDVSLQTRALIRAPEKYSDLLIEDLGASALVPERPSSIEETIIYVRTTGSDSLGDGSSGSPYRTIRKALQKVPSFIDAHYYTIDCTGITETYNYDWSWPAHVGGGSFELDLTPTAFSQDWLRTPVKLVAVPTTLYTLNDGTTSTVAQARTGLLSVTDTSQSWSVNELKGKMIIGSGISEHGVIQSNTADTIVTTLTTLPTSPVTIVEPSCTINFGENPATGLRHALTIDINCETVFLGIDFAMNDTSAFNRFRNKASATFYLCNLPGLACDEGGTGQFDVYACYITDGSLADQGHHMNFQRSYFDGVSGSGITVNNHASPQHSWLWCIFEGCPAIGHGGSSTPMTNFRLEDSWILNGTADGVLYRGGGVSRVLNCIIEGCVGDAIDAQNPGKLRVQNVGDNHGSNPNGGYGINVTNGTFVTITTVDVQGTSGELFVGTLGAQTYANGPYHDLFDVDSDGTILLDGTTPSRALSVPRSVHITDGGIRMTERAAAPGSDVAGEAVLWIRNDTPNVAVLRADDGTETVLGAGGGGGTLDGAYDFGGAGAGRTVTVDAGPVALTEGVDNSTLGILALTGAAHTAAPIAEYNDVHINLAQTKQFTTGGGTIADQRAIRIQAPTYSADTNALTLTNASTVEISGPPVAGTNVTITNAAALRIAAGQILFPFGTSAAPSLGFTGDPDTGFYGAAGEIFISHGGSGTYVFRATTMRAPGGSAAQPAYSFATATNSGVFLSAADVGIATSGVEAIRWNTSQQTQIPDGSAATPSLIFSGTTTGIYGSGTNTSIAVSGSQVVGFGANGMNMVANGVSTFCAIGFGGLHGWYKTGSGATVQVNYLATSNNSIGSFERHGWDFTQGVATATPDRSLMTVTSAAHTAMTAAEYINVDFDLSADQQFTAGATIATQRAMRIQAPTYSATAAQTITNASTVEISGAPIAGTNMTITNPAALRIAAGQTLIPDGLVGTPAVAFGSSTNSGLYWHASAGVAIAYLGVQQMRITTSVADFAGSVRTGAGTVGAPSHSFTGATDKGMFDGGSNILEFATAGTQAMQINASQQVLLGIDGTEGAPAVSWIANPAMGMFKAGNSLGFSPNSPVTFGMSAIGFSPGSGDNLSLGETTGNGWRYLHISPAAADTSGTPAPRISVIEVAHTTLTAAEYTALDYNLSATVQFTAGATIATQRAAYIQAPTYAATAAQTITDAATLAISGAPIAGTNMTLTRSVALRIEGGQISVPLGTSAAPSLCFNGDTNTGIYSTSADRIAFATGAGLRVEVRSAGINVSVSGSEGAPSFFFGGDADTGFWSPGGNLFALSTASTEAVRWNASQQTLVPDGVAAAPSYAFAGNTGSGLGRNGNEVFISANGSEMVRVATTALYPFTTTKTTELGISTRRWEKIWGADIDLEQAVATSGSPQQILVTGGAHTTLANADLAENLFDLGRTVQFTGGAATVTNYRGIELRAPTLNAATTGFTVTNASLLYLNNQPQDGGANITLTNAYAIFVDAGLCRFDGDGTDVFELPADATDPTGGGAAANGRIPVKIGGSTVYLAYY